MSVAPTLRRPKQWEQDSFSSAPDRSPWPHKSANHPVPKVYTASPTETDLACRCSRAKRFSRHFLVVIPETPTKKEKEKPFRKHWPRSNNQDRLTDEGGEGGKNLEIIQCMPRKKTSAAVFSYSSIVSPPSPTFSLTMDSCGSLFPPPFAR